MSVVKITAKGASHLYPTGTLILEDGRERKEKVVSFRKCDECEDAEPLFKVLVARVDRFVAIRNVKELYLEDNFLTQSYNIVEVENESNILRSYKGA